MPPRSKKSEAEAPTDTTAAESTPAALSSDQVKTYTTAILLHHAIQEQGELSDESAHKWGKAHALGFHPEIFAQLIEKNLLVREPGLTVLSSSGWQMVLAIRQAESAAALARKDDELKAHLDHAAAEQVCLANIKAKSSAVDANKGALQMAKEELKQAYEELEALCAGGAQTSFLDNKDKMHKAPAEGDLAPDWAKILPPVTADRTKVAPANGLPEQKTIMGAVVLDIVFEAEKRKLDKSLIVQAYDTPFIVSALWIEAATGATRANLLRLYSKDEFAQLHEAQYGRAVDGFDQSDEAKAQRETGGAWCGLVVRVGQKQYVVGPQSDALHVMHPGNVATDAPASGFDAKAAAAGEKDLDDEGEDRHDAADD